MKTLLALYFLSGAALFAQATPAPKVKDVAELERLENTWNEAHLRGDIVTLDRLWGDDLVITVPRLVMTKTEALNVWRSGKLKFRKYETSDLQIRPYGDAAVVSGRLKRTRDFPDGQSRDDDWRFTKVYVRQHGAWQVVAFHASEAP